MAAPAADLGVGPSESQKRPIGYPWTFTTIKPTRGWGEGAQTLLKQK